MPRIGKLEMLKVEMVAVFVAEGAEKGSERSDVFLYRGPHPDADFQGWKDRSRQKVQSTSSRECGQDVTPARGRRRETPRETAREIGGTAHRRGGHPAF